MNKTEFTQNAQITVFIIALLGSGSMQIFGILSKVHMLIKYVVIFVILEIVITLILRYKYNSWR